MFQPIYHVTVSPTDGNGPTQGQRKTPVVQTLDSAIHWITQLVLPVFIRWIVIYPVDSAIHRLNNWGQMTARQLKMLRGMVHAIKEMKGIVDNRILLCDTGLESVHKG